MTDMTQPMPGRVLNEAMAKIMGWNVVDATLWASWRDIEKIEHFPCLMLRESTEDDRVCFEDKKKPWIKWNPSTRIADAFEVMSSHADWSWYFIETEPYLGLRLLTDDCKAIAKFVPWSDFTDPDGTRNRPEAYSFGICWAALVWLEAQKKVWEIKVLPESEKKALLETLTKMKTELRMWKDPFSIDPKISEDDETNK